MARMTFLAIGGGLLALGLSLPALAQDAAETAQILSGTGQSTGSASRSMGSAVSDSMNSAAGQIRATWNGNRQSGRDRGRPAQGAYVIPASTDMLDGTDAPSYRLGNGASIRVSGKLIPAPEPSCTSNCPEAPPRANTAP